MLKRLLYISGSGRSGSTLLERLLHSAPQNCALGELHVLWRQAPEGITCACGQRLADDPWWRQVLGRGAIGSAELAEMGALESVVSRTGFLLSKRFDLAAIRHDRRVARFLELQFRLYDAIAAQTGAAVLIDSSKAGPRAWLLATDPRVGILHLDRHPSDVLASWRSRKFDKGLGADMQRLSIRQAGADWFKAELLIRRLRRRRPVLTLAYDQFVRQPRATMAATLGATAGDIAWTGERCFSPAGGYHSLNGNPDRFESGEIEIAPRRVDRRRLSPVDRYSVAMVGSMLRWALPPLPGPR
jgi:hypothetical protein